MADKHVIKSETQELAVELGPLKFHKRRWFNIAALAAIAVSNATTLKHFPGLTRNGLDISAAADQGQFEWREVTGEDILALTERVGGNVDNVVRDENGLIVEIQASIETAFEYDAEEMSEVIDSLYASGLAPKKLLGDLAQTSVTTANGQVQIISLAEWTISWKRKTADATTTDDAEYESAVGSTKSWSVKSKFMFLDGDASQSTYVVAALSDITDGIQTWNFFPTIEQGRAAWKGNAIIDSIDWASGMGKCLGMDVSLKGTGPLYAVTQAIPVANPNTVTGQSAQV